MARTTPLAKAIEKAREQLGLSRAEYAERVGLSLPGLAKLEKGGAPNGNTLARLQARGAIEVTPKLVESFRNEAA